MFFSVMGYGVEKPSELLDVPHQILLRCGRHRKKIFCVLVYNAGKPAALYPTPVQILLRYGTQPRSKHPTISNLFSVVSHKEGESPPLYPTT